MPSRVRFDWRGDDVIGNLRQAARRAINEIVDESADDAQATHEWQNTPTKFSKTGGELERQIASEHARQRKTGNPVGRFGFTRRRGFYGLFQEKGTMHQRIYLALLPAADRHFPALADRIRRRLR